MSDTNWCTFCDCAINPNSDLIYCSEECFKLDALSNQSIFPIADGNQYRGNQTQHSPLFASTQSCMSPVMPPSPQFDQSRRGSCSSVSSEDLAAMYFDMLPSTPTNDTPTVTTVPSVKSSSFTAPVLSSSISPACSHEETLGTPTIDYSTILPLQEKQATTNITLSHWTMF